MEKSASKSPTVYTYGLYLGVASIIYRVILIYSGLLGNTALEVLSLLIMVVFIVLGLINYKNTLNGGILKYGRGVGIGTLISLVGSVVSSVFIYVFYAFIDPAKHMEYIILMQEQQLAQGVSEAQIEQMQIFMEPMQSPMGIAISGIFFAVLFGLIISLIVSAILKKDPETTF